MSRINFHIPNGGAEVRGSERAMMGSLCNRLAVAVLNPYWNREALTFVLPDTSYIKSNAYDPHRFERDFDTWFSVGQDGGFRMDGKSLDCFTVALNTACRVGGDVIKLCARLHGQCEIHAWIAGENRKWLSEIIQLGRLDHIFRDDAGWEEAIALLKKSNKHPVVMSYSVCESFPNKGVAGYDNGDNWDKLSHKKQWELAFDKLQASKGGLELKPDRWDNFYFGDNYSAFEILEAAYRLKSAAVVA